MNPLLPLARPSFLSALQHRLHLCGFPFRKGSRSWLYSTSSADHYDAQQLTPSPSRGCASTAADASAINELRTRWCSSQLGIGHTASTMASRRRLALQVGIQASQVSSRYEAARLRRTRIVFHDPLSRALTQAGVDRCCAVRTTYLFQSEDHQTCIANLPFGSWNHCR